MIDDFEGAALREYDEIEREEKAAQPIVQLLAGLQNITTATPPETIEITLRQIAATVTGADPVRRAMIQMVTTEHFKAVGLSVKPVEAAFKLTTTTGRADMQGAAVSLSDPIPWPEVVDGAALLAEIVRAVVRFVALPEAGATTIALWVLHSHAHDAAFVSPILAFTSPEKRCGKTTALAVVQSIVPRPCPASNIDRKSTRLNSSHVEISYAV